MDCTNQRTESFGKIGVADTDMKQDSIFSNNSEVIEMS
jgi:hypothetical protein